MDTDYFKNNLFSNIWTFNIFSYMYKIILIISIHHYHSQTFHRASIPFPSQIFVFSILLLIAPWVPLLITATHMEMDVRSSTGASTTYLLPLSQKKSDYHFLSIHQLTLAPLLVLRLHEFSSYPFLSFNCLYIVLLATNALNWCGEQLCHIKKHLTVLLPILSYKHMLFLPLLSECSLSIG